jgi:acyl-CoA synthetase (AMP-forming)/AMP-acid ligase II/acyl carrier protein
VTAIPIDPAATPELVARIARVAAPRGALVGDNLPTMTLSCEFVWSVRDIRWESAQAPPVSSVDASARAHVGAETLAEIVFTSGTTAEPKGVLITHGNIVANIAPIEREAIAYRRYAVIQGYGLTETAPIVAWNHPFKLRHGTVGRPLEGVTVRLADDGEILVKGPTVTSGYLNAPDQTRTALDGGWFHTGDVGSFDPLGHLIIRGRKKDVITTSEGMKVYPEDVERVLETIAGVREAAVIGRVTDHDESVHAVLVLQPRVDSMAILRDANARLEPHQRIREVSIWARGPLPRTEPMRKLKRFEIRRWVEQGSPETGTVPGVAGGDIEGLLSRYAKKRALTPDTTLEELGLTSLDRVELLMALEQEAQVTIGEAAVAEAWTVSDLRRLTEHAEGATVPAETVPFPRLARRVREAVVALRPTVGGGAGPVRVKRDRRNAGAGQVLHQESGPLIVSVATAAFLVSPVRRPG